MKQTIYLIIALVAILISCGKKDSTVTPDPSSPSTDPTEDTSYGPMLSQPGTFVRGADVSWLSEMEHDGKKFKDTEGNDNDCFKVLAQIGCNTIRLRVWVDPKDGWSSKDDMVGLAKRARKAGMRLLIDFHYSDFFCDPSRQIPPYAWKDFTYEQTKDAIALHTTEILNALKAQGLEPEWVQVGNEITPGMLFPHGQLWDSNGELPNNYTRLSGLTNSGYNAVKSIFPNAKVILHCNNAFENKNWWYRRMKAAGAKFDIIGLSHYPMDNTSKTYSEMNKAAFDNLKLLENEFKVPVMFVEFGTKSSSQSQAKSCVEDFQNRFNALELSKYCGVIYWEPEVYGGWKPAVYTSTDKEWNKYHTGSATLNWGSYNMGAFTATGQPNDAIKTLLNNSDNQ